MRRRKAPKRKVLPDPKFHSELAAKFINSMMKVGKKSVAERAFYSAVDVAGERVGVSGFEVFEKAVHNV